MSRNSILLLTQFIKMQLERLAFLQEYQQNIDDPYVKPVLALVIEDTHEAIARISSRLRQLNQAPGRMLDETDPKLIRQARARRGLVDKLRFVRLNLKYELEWYEAHRRDFIQDADTQAILVALAEQTRVRLERWENLMKDLKASLE